MLPTRLPGDGGEPTMLPHRDAHQLLHPMYPKTNDFQIISIKSHLGFLHFLHKLTSNEYYYYYDCYDHSSSNSG
jgi:hypothetical protein